MRRFLVFTLLLAGCISGWARNSTRVDLSGIWDLNLTKSGLSANKKFAVDRYFIVCTGSRVEIRSFFSGHEAALDEYVADGQTRVAKNAMGLEEDIQAYWKGSALLIVSTTHRSPARVSTGLAMGWTLPDPYVVTRRWSLLDHGRALKWEESIDGSDFATLVYDRRPILPLMSFDK
jgi:hypothetical protein